MATIDTVTQGQNSQDIIINAGLDAVKQAAIYARRASTTSGLTFGFYGGLVVKPDGTLLDVASSTVALTASQTSYIVADKASGAVTAALNTTNWNDRKNYWRLYSVVTGSASITSWTDFRQIGLMAGGDHGVTFRPPVIKTTAFTVADTEDDLIVNGSASVTATLPAAANYAGRRITIKTIAAFTVISASSNVKPLDTNTAGTAILAATAGKWAQLVSDGTNWVIMAGN